MHVSSCYFIIMHNSHNKHLQALRRRQPF